MTNPYGSPSRPSKSNRPNRSRSAAGVKAPAIALIIVAAIALVVGTLALIGDVVLIASGAVAKLEEMNTGPISEYTQITIRTIWGIALIIASAFVLYGAIQMVSLKNYGASKMAAIIAMIPLLGPCCILGIPFGIWAFVVLGKPEVKAAFR